MSRQFISRGSQRVAIAAADDEPVAALPEHARNHQPEAAAGACDESNPIRVSHDASI
jgi:hypothetical protein